MNCFGPGDFGLSASSGPSFCLSDCCLRREGHKAPPYESEYPRKFGSKIRENQNAY